MPHNVDTIQLEQRLEHVAEQMHLDLPGLTTWLENVVAALFAPAPPSGLDARELRVLRDMEIVDRKPAAPENRASLRAAATYVTLVRSSLRLAEVAEKLNRSTGHIATLARKGELYTLELGGELLFPAFQFTGRGKVPGLHAVLARLPRDLDPLEVLGFLNTPAYELEVDGVFRTPLEWLEGGGSAEPLAALADELGMPS